MTPAPENAAMSQILTLRSAIKGLEIRHSHKNGSFENGSMQLACRYGQPSKLDCGGRGVRSLSRCRQSTSQPRYAFSRGCSLAQDGKGRARTRQGHKPRPRPFSVVATPSEGASGRLSVRRWISALTGDRLDGLIHIGAVRVDRALHHWRRGGRRWRRRPRGGEGKAAGSECSGCQDNSQRYELYHAGSPHRRPRFACGQPYPATTTARSVHASIAGGELSMWIPPSLPPSDIDDPKPATVIASHASIALAQCACRHRRAHSDQSNYGSGPLLR